MYFVVVISVDIWLLGGVKAVGGIVGVLAIIFKAFVRVVGYGLLGINGFCLLLLSERRAGRRRRFYFCSGFVFILYCVVVLR